MQNHKIYECQDFLNIKQNIYVVWKPWVVRRPSDQNLLVQTHCWAFSLFSVFWPSHFQKWYQPLRKVVEYDIVYCWEIRIKLTDLKDNFYNLASILICLYKPMFPFSGLICQYFLIPYKRYTVVAIIAK